MGGRLCIGRGEIKLFWVAYTHFGGFQPAVKYQLFTKFFCVPPIPPKMCSFCPKWRISEEKLRHNTQKFQLFFLSGMIGGFMLGVALYSVGKPNLSVQARLFSHLLANEEPQFHVAVGHWVGRLRWESFVLCYARAASSGSGRFTVSITPTAIHASIRIFAGGCT